MVDLSIHPYEINSGAAMPTHGDRGLALHATLEVEPEDKLLALCEGPSSDRPRADRAL